MFIYCELETGRGIPGDGPVLPILFFLALGISAYVFLVKREYAPKAS